MYKIIMDFIEKHQPEYVGIGSLDNKEGKNYHTVYASLTDNKANRIPGYFRKDISVPFNSPEGPGRMVVLKKKKPTLPLDENECWDGYKQGNPKTKISTKTGERVNNCVPIDEEIDEYDVENEEDEKDFVSFLKEYSQQLSESQLNEAEYHGRKVQLGKIMQGDIKKFKVYVKNNKGKVVKVNFGFGGKSAKGKRMVIKAKNPKRRAAYRARHNCSNPGPRWKANYWSCKKW
jgi:hypothetical protein